MKILARFWPKQRNAPLTTALITPKHRDLLEDLGKITLSDDEFEDDDLNTEFGEWG